MAVGHSSLPNGGLDRSAHRNGLSPLGGGSSRATSGPVTRQDALLASSSTLAAAAAASSASESDTTADNSSQDAEFHPRKVLLLTDVQVTTLHPKTGVPNAAVIRENLTRALHLARSAPSPPLIVHVRNCGEPGEPDAPGTPGWELALAPLPGEPVLDKTKNNAFTGTRLGELVSCKAPLVVVGMQSDFCIRATCSAALGRGNTVFLVEDAHGTYDRPEAYAAGGPAVLSTPAAHVVREIESELEEAGVFVVKVDDLPHIFAEDA